MAIDGIPYAIERFLLALATIATTFATWLGAFHAIGADRLHHLTVDTYIRRHPNVNPELGYLRSLMKRRFPFDPWAPVYEQYVELATAYLTWPPIGVPLLACGLLAVTVAWRVDR